MEKSLYTGGDK